MCEHLGFEQVKIRQIIAATRSLHIQGLGDIVLDFHGGKKFWTQWLTIHMDFVTESVCVYAVYTYLYQYSLTLVYMNKSTSDSVTITDQMYAF